MEDRRRYRTTESIGFDTQKNLQVINENPYRKLRCSSMNTGRIQMKSEQSSHDDEYSC